MVVLQELEVPMDWLWAAPITVASGNLAWVTPEDYLPSGVNFYTEWREGDWS